MRGTRSPEDEIPKSRRELRRERRRKKWRANLAGLVRRAPSSSKANRKRSLEDGAPKGRRARREMLHERRWGKWRRAFRELLITSIVAAALVFGVIRPFIVSAYTIPSESMVPTLEVGDRLLVNKFVYRFHEPRRGDIVIFSGVPGEGDDTLIKRVVGLPGDKIRVRGDTLYVNNRPQSEPYVDQQDPSRGSYGPTFVPDGHIFVMGDNRGNSADSRVFGPLPLEDVQGEAFLTYWPLTRISYL